MKKLVFVVAALLLAGINLSTPAIVRAESQAATDTNLIPNPSLEVSGNGKAPDSWLSSNWGNNSAAFRYLPSGHTGSHSVRVRISSYTNGAANWYYNDVPITAGQPYRYDDWYQSNVDTEVDAEVVMNDGSTQYFWLGNVIASPSAWSKFSTIFTPPTDAKSMAIYHLIAKVGYLDTDDYSMAAYTPAQFNRGIVSLTFDDGWRSQYINGLPLLQKYNQIATFYIVTGFVGRGDYMNKNMLQTLYNQGHELGSHTVHHPHLPRLSISRIDGELGDSQTSLRQWFGPSVANNFATPYGEYDTKVLTEIKKYYRSHRSVDDGFNSKDFFDIYNIKVKSVTSETPPSQILGWVNQAAQDHTWLVLVYHEIGASVGHDIYHTDTADVDQELNGIKQSGIAVETVDQALTEIQSQL